MEINKGGFVAVHRALIFEEKRFFSNLSSSCRIQNAVGKSQMSEIRLTLLIQEESLAAAAAHRGYSTVTCL